MKTEIKRYALAGCSGRGLYMYAKPLVETYSARAQLVGLFDINQGRMDYINQFLNVNIPTFTDFDAMMRATRPDIVIVATMDSVHHEFIIRAFDHGCDVICEKPMTIDEVKCRQILDAERRTGRKVTVTFNYRFAPFVTRIRELLAGGAIGKVMSVDFIYQLDRFHGADYFRRWHRRKENSGGLLISKATHHFDLINWFLGQDPVEVFAHGSRQFYGPTRQERGTNCRACDHTKTCEFYFDINATRTGREMYANVEHYDGYLRDQCVFGDAIDIEDTMTLSVRYSGGTQMAYSLNAHCVYEGWRLALNGTTGRLEAADWDSGPYFVKDKQDKQDILLHRWNGTVFNISTETISVPIDTSGHFGGDVRIQRMLFDGPQPDPIGHTASSRAGAMSLLTGAAANRSIATGQPIRIEQL
ncbi:MAG: Gfo/Idh/MocA family oxidoreductase [Verrucomicrobia bacterium]|nr:Gfo/Idh/MocA family oxidoreductase [Verrucomicrobiota bacterium]